MRTLLLAAAVLAVGIGIVHSWLGERYIIVRLLRRDNLPKLFGGDRFTKQTLRFAWHLTTLAWWGLGAVLLVLSGAFSGVTTARGILAVVSFTFLASAILSFVFTKGRHVSWIVFAAIAVLCALAA
jgi:hypothetical protein